MHSIPRLETERLQLRAIFPSDAAEILELMSDLDVARLHELDPITSMGQAHQLITNYTHWFQNDQAVRWGILKKETGKLIGTCCFDTFNPNYRSVNLGYNLRSDHWGQGYASEAVKRIIELAFEKGISGPVNRIQAITVPENNASEKLLLRLGFKEEGLMREYGYWKGNFHDMHLFSRLRSDSEKT